MNARLQDKRTWLVGGAAVAVVVSAASWFFVLDPVVSDTDSIRSQTAGVMQQNRDAQDKITQLANTQTQLGALQHDLTVKLSALPMANGLPDFTRQLNRQASDLGLTVTSITVGGFTAAGGNGGNGGTSGTGAGTASGDATGTSGTSGTSGTGTTAPAAPAGGPVAIAVSVASTGPVAAQLAFVRAIRLAGPRRALVNSVNITSSTNGSTGKPGTTMTVTLTIFATPATADARAQIAHLLELK